jgi:hypothetical protein
LLGIGKLIERDCIKEIKAYRNAEQEDNNAEMMRDL